MACTCHCVRNQCSIFGMASRKRRSRSSSGPVSAVVRWGTIYSVNRFTQRILADRPVFRRNALWLRNDCVGVLSSEVREPLIKSTMSRVADKNGVIARRATPVVVILRCQGAQHSERPFLLQPARELALRAVCYVRVPAMGDRVFVVAFT